MRRCEQNRALGGQLLGQLTESSEGWLRQRVAPVLRRMDTPVLQAN